MNILIDSWKYWIDEACLLIYKTLCIRQLGIDVTDDRYMISLDGTKYSEKGQKKVVNR